MLRMLVVGHHYTTLEVVKCSICSSAKVGSSEVVEFFLFFSEVIIYFRGLGEIIFLGAGGYRLLS